MRNIILGLGAMSCLMNYSFASDKSNVQHAQTNVYNDNTGLPLLTEKQLEDISSVPFGLSEEELYAWVINNPESATHYIFETKRKGDQNNEQETENLQKKMKVRSATDLIKDALDSFEKDQEKLDLDNLIKIVGDLKQVELNNSDKVPAKLSYIQQYPLIGLLMTNCPQGKEEEFIGVLKSLVKDFDFNRLDNKLDFVHQVGKEIMERSVYGDKDAAEDLVSEAFPPTLPVDEETLFSLFQAYACIGKTIEDTDSWNFFKAYLFIYANQLGQYSDKIFNLYSLDKSNVKNLVEDGKILMQQLPENSHWRDMYVQK